MAEIGYEYFTLALETTRGTAIAAPTHYAGVAGTLTPILEEYEPDESRGTLEEKYRSAVVRKHGEWAGEGGLDTYALPLFLEMISKGGVTPTTPSGATLARLRDYKPNILGDDIKTATVWFGDPNVQIWRSKFATLDELTIGGTSGGTDGATMGLSGTAHFPEKVADPTLPAQLVGPLITNVIRIWIDTGASAIGTTEVVGRIISATATIPLNASKKYAGTQDGNYTRIGRGKRRISLAISLEVPDTTQYDLYEAGTLAKVRVRWVGPQIEAGHDHYVEVDAYGKLRGFGWGEYESTNRAMDLTINTLYDATYGASWGVRVQNDRATL